MISGAYSNKYRATQDEHVERLKEKARIEGQIIKDRVKELSKETNRRRRALENRKKEFAQEEERNRQAVLTERRKKKEEATQKFQKEDYQKKKSRPNSATHQTNKPPQVVGDGIKVVRGHIVVIRNGKQVTVPSLEDALNMVSNPYNENTILYHGPQDLYRDDSDSLDNAPDLFDDHLQLREETLQNGRPMFAFMNGEITEGALPQTIRTNSPSGSLASLDSLDEIPQGQLPLQDKPSPIPGIIVKDKVKSTGRRRVTFSDSIEFDDGLTGQLVTTEKESCKQYVKQYNSRMAANNATYSTVKPNIAASKASHSPEKIIGTPGNTPIKSGDMASNVSSVSSGSMVVPMSVYSQLPLHKPIASTGQSTCLTNTHTERPQQCVAEVNDNPRDEDHDQIAIDDSLNAIDDSLEVDAAPQNTDQPRDDSLEVKDDHDDAIVDDADIHHDNQQINPTIDYYGNPATIYKHPFGQRNTSQDTSVSNSVAKELEPRCGYASHLLLENAGSYAADSDKMNQMFSSNINVKDNSHANTPSSTTEYSVVYSPTYYKSWYPGSFFSSVFGEETEIAKVVKKTNIVAYDLIDNKHNTTKLWEISGKAESNLNKNYSKSTGRVNPLGNSDRTDDINQNEEQNSDHMKNGKQGNKIIARPPHPSTRHKGVVYNSPLHRKRALASTKQTSGKQSSKSPTRRSPVVKTTGRNQATPAKIRGKNNENQQKGKKVGSRVTRRGQSQSSRGYSSSSDDNDELLLNIQRDMERISMLNNVSPAQEQHQKILNTINFGESPAPFDNHSTKSDFKSVYKKVHKPRVGSAKQRSQLVLSNNGQPSKIPIYSGPSGSTNNQEANNSNSRLTSVNQPRNGGVFDQTEAQNTTIHDKSGQDIVHPKTAALTQSIPLDKTPTDDEINILWDRVRNCLHHKDTQSVGSDSCVNRIDVRRSRNQESYYMTCPTSRDTSLSHNSRAASLTGIGTMHSHGSQEVLRRYGSADNIGPYRQQPLLQHRALRTHQSGQGKPPMITRQQFSPMTSRQAPTITMSARAGPAPLTQNELRAVMKASQQETNQPMTRTGPSALSIEENKLLESLDRLNERLKVQEALTVNINRRHERTSLTISHPTNHQRSSSATYRHR